MDAIYKTLTIDPTLTFSTRITDFDDEAVHNHDFYEIFYILEGEITHSYDGIKEKLTTGDAYLITPIVKHSFIRTKTCSHRDFMISDSLFNFVCNFIDTSFFAQISDKKILRFRLETTDIMFFEKTIANFLENSDTHKKKNFEKVLTASLLSFAYISLGGEKHSGIFKNHCLQILGVRFLSFNAIEEIRKDLGYNKFYLCKKFKNTFGVTLTDYVNNMKINHAKYLLQTSNYKISEICEQIGIESQTYFRKLFTRKYGVTPAKYRKKI